MASNPIIAAWIAGGVIWGAALIGLTAIGGPLPMHELQDLAHSAPWVGSEEVADAYERALDGDPWGDADAYYGGLYRPAGAPGI